MQPRIPLNVLIPLALIAGWLVGGIANLVADELPARRQSGRPAWTLRRLPHTWTLGWYFLRGGVCPHCGEKRPLRAPLLELAMIAGFGAAAWRAGGDPIAWAVLCVYSAFLLTILVIDFEQRRVLNVMLLLAAVLALLFSLLGGWRGLLDAALGGAIGFGLFLLLALVGRGRLGAGDVKLAGVIGLMVGFPRVLTALAIGILLGGAAAIGLLISRRAGRKARMAYAPYLALGALAVLFFVAFP